MLIQHKHMGVNFLHTGVNFFEKLWGKIQSVLFIECEEKQKQTLQTKTKLNN